MVSQYCTQKISTIYLLDLPITAKVKMLMRSSSLRPGKLARSKQLTIAVRMRLASSTCLRKLQYSRTPGIPKVFVCAPMVTNNRSYGIINSLISHELPSQITDSHVKVIPFTSTFVANASRNLASRFIWYNDLIG